MFFFTITTKLYEQVMHTSEKLYKHKAPDNGGLNIIIIQTLQNQPRPKRFLIVYSTISKLLLN